ncbi:MAG: hypothetical protein AB7T39_20845 [Alphaproteobacteria bacterium]
MAVLVAVAVLSMPGSTALLHVHTSAGHEHAEHHHGPAAHSHASVAHHHQHETATPGNGTAVESCDPGDHVVPMVFACVAGGQVDVPLPEVVAANALTTPQTTPVVLTPADVRAHSPPRITDAPLRAPPPTHFA